MAPRHRRRLPEPSVGEHDAAVSIASPGTTGSGEKRPRDRGRLPAAAERTDQARVGPAAWQFEFERLPSTPQCAEPPPGACSLGCEHVPALARTRAGTYRRNGTAFVVRRVLRGHGLPSSPAADPPASLGAPRDSEPQGGREPHLWAPRQLRIAPHLLGRSGCCSPGTSSAGRVPLSFNDEHICRSGSALPCAELESFGAVVAVTRTGTT